MKKLNVKDFKTADLILDKMDEFYKRFPQGKINKIYLGTEELEHMGLAGVDNAILFDIPVQIINKRSYISLDTNG